MLGRMSTRTTSKTTEITLVVPSKAAAQMKEIIANMWTLAGHKMRRNIIEDDEIDDDKIYTMEEVFPDSHPGTILNGLRTREGLTQKRMAEKLGIPRRHISEMERGLRPISLEMAKLIGATFNTGHKVFL
jgi:DNA-binding XRE family transcriptional regulator